eukprot:8951279-Pyramimonas_sp.AAC.1
MKRHLSKHGSIEQKPKAFAKSRRLVPKLDMKRIWGALHKKCGRGGQQHTCMDAFVGSPQIVLMWRKLWYALPKCDRDHRLANLFRRSKEMAGEG